MAKGKDRPPAFQFYPREFLTSRAVLLMTPEQRGGYVLLICHGWLSPRPGWLPDDDGQLAALSGLLGRWTECREAIAKAFTIRKGWWVQPRMVSERRAQRRRRKHRVDGALATNERRWGKTSKVAERRLSVSPPVALHLPLQSASASATALEPRVRGRGERPPRSTSLKTFLPATAEDEADCVARFKLGAATVSILAERVNLEGPGRGYVSGRSALLNWCKTEIERMASQPQHNGKAIADAAIAEFLAEDSNAQG